MLFYKSLLRELRSTAGGVLAVLLTSLVTMILIRALGRAAAGRVDSELVLPLIVFNSIYFLNSVLMLTVYVAILLVLSRWWRDSEMVIWLSSGKSLVQFISPIVRFVIPMVAVVALLSLALGPWAQQQIVSYEEEIQSRGDAQRVSPGQFRESYSGNKVFFLEDVNEDTGQIGTVFVRSQEADGRWVLLAAAKGRFEKDQDGQAWAVLEYGHRTDLADGQLDTRTTAFDAYRIRLEQSAPVGKGRESMRAIPTPELLERLTPPARGELFMRFGLPLLTFCLAVLAVPLAISDARSGRAYNLIRALLLYLIVTNVFTAVQISIGQGKLDLLAVAWVLPVAVLALAGLMLWWHLTRRPSVGEMLWTAIRWLRQRARRSPETVS